MTRAQQILRQVGRTSNQVYQRSKPIAIEVARQIWRGLKRADARLDQFVRRRASASDAALLKTLALVVISVVSLLLLPLTFTLFLVVVIILGVKVAVGRPPSPPNSRRSKRLLPEREDPYGREIPRRRRP